VRRAHNGPDRYSPGSYQREDLRLAANSGRLAVFLNGINLTFYQIYDKMELPLIGCPPQPVRGIFYQASQVLQIAGRRAEESKIWGFAAYCAAKPQIL
jgi:hypothetical protein